MMTFRTKFKIGQSVIHEGKKHIIDFVTINVGRSFKEVLYYLNDITDFNVSEGVLLKENPIVGE
jgi:hypothetical protein